MFVGFCFSIASGSLFASEKALYKEALMQYDALLKTAVNHSLVDYDVLKSNQHTIEQYLYALGVTQLDALQKDEKLALYINAYNVFVIRLILDYWPYIRSIKDIPEFPVPRRFKDKRWRLAGKLVSLNDVEREYLESLRVPTAYMALVCAARSCPDLRKGVYTAASIKKQLTEATRKYLSQDKGLRWGMKKLLLGAKWPVLYVSEIFRWKKPYIEYSGYSVLSFIEEFAPVEARAFIAKYRKGMAVFYLDYDWALNAQNAGER